MIHLIRHIRWAFNVRLKFIIAIGLLYVIAGLVSSLDFSGKTSSVFCGFLTVGVAIASFVVLVKLYKLAKKIESSKVWLCTCCCRDSAKQVLLGYILLMGSLGTLKLWSVTDLFIDHWGQLPLSYHAQAWAYLSHNAGSVVMAYILLSVFEAKYKCAQKERMFINADELKCEEHL